MDEQILEILGRYHSLERKTLLQLTLTRGTFTLAREREFDAALLALKESSRAVAPSGLHGRWMLAPPAPPRPEIRRNEPATKARGAGRRA